MRGPNSIVAFLVGVALPLTVRAQVVAPLDSVQRAAMMASAMQLAKPADFVLHHRTELALSGAQVSALEALAAALRDSVGVRQARLIARMEASPPSATVLAVSGWSGALDERTLRDALCQQAITQVETVLEMARDRRAAAALLTPAQVTQLPQLQAGDLLKAIKR